MCTRSVKAITRQHDNHVFAGKRLQSQLLHYSDLLLTTTNEKVAGGNECAHIHKLLFHRQTFRQISLLVMRLGVAADKARAQERTETFKCNVTWGISSLVTYRLLFPLVTHASRGVRVSLPSSRLLVATVLCSIETYNKLDFLGAYFHGSSVSRPNVPGTERQETAGSSQTLWG